MQNYKIIAIIAILSRENLQRFWSFRRVKQRWEVIGKNNWNWQSTEWPNFVWYFFFNSLFSSSTRLIQSNNMNLCRSLIVDCRFLRLKKIIERCHYSHKWFSILDCFIDDYLYPFVWEILGIFRAKKKIYIWSFTSSSIVIRIQCRLKIIAIVFTWRSRKWEKKIQFERKNFPRTTEREASSRY